MQAPEGALTKDDLSALEMLEQARRVKRHYVNAGTARPESVEGASHNVSLTVSVDTDEWEEVDSVQAPLQGVSPDMEGEAQRHAWGLWEMLNGTMSPVDYDDLSEEEDNTKPLETLVCSGGQCDLR
jgi:hypothetical protein